MSLGNPTTSSNDDSTTTAATTTTITLRPGKEMPPGPRWRTILLPRSMILLITMPALVSSFLPLSFAPLRSPFLPMAHHDHDPPYDDSSYFCAYIRVRATEDKVLRSSPFPRGWLPLPGR